MDCGLTSTELLGEVYDRGADEGVTKSSLLEELSELDEHASFTETEAHFPNLLLDCFV